MTNQILSHGFPSLAVNDNEKPLVAAVNGGSGQKESKQSEELRNRGAIKVSQNYWYLVKIENQELEPKTAPYLG